MVVTRCIVGFLPSVCGLYFPASLLYAVGNSVTKSQYLMPRTLPEYCSAYFVTAKPCIILLLTWHNAYIELSSDMSAISLL